MLTPSREQRDYQAEVRRFLERTWPLSRSRAVLAAGSAYDPAAWSQLAALGALGLLVPSGQGGAGAGVAEAALVSEELGRVLLPVPFLSSAVIAARLLTLLGGDPAARYLAGIAAGTCVATVAFLDSRGRWSPGEPDLMAVPAEPRTGDGWLLQGTAPFVADAQAADVVLVVARAPDGLAVLAVEDARAALAPVPRDCLDPTQPLSRVRFDGVAATRIAATADVAAVMDNVAATAIACATAAALGSAERCLEMSVGYARTRVQFGRTIGSYQAIKHRCADMFIGVQSARSAVYHLLSVLDAATAGGGPADLALAVGIAKACSSDVLVSCAHDAIQIHGGIGFTWEHDAHLYLRRAMTHAHLLGDAAHHRHRVAELAGITG